MVDKTFPVIVPCSKHDSEFVIRVDPELEAEKQTYCYTCIMDNKDPKTLDSRLVPIGGFLAAAAQKILEEKNNLQFSEKPLKYQNALSRKEESKEILKKHLEKEKEKVNQFFANLTEEILKIIDKKKAEHMEILDEQEDGLNSMYDDFERQLKQSYLQEEDIAPLFPTYEELKKNFLKVRNSTELEKCVLDVKKILPQSQLGWDINKRTDEQKKAYFDSFLEILQGYETKPPTLKIEKLDIESLKNGIIKLLTRLLEKTFDLQDSVNFSAISYSDCESKIINPTEFMLIKSWLPAEYQKNFNPKLIFRGSNDGMEAKYFHEKCNDKKATITIVQGKFKGNPEVQKVGGFLDEAWHSTTKYIKSKEAFIFSITAKIKCPVENEEYAAQGHASYGASFGRTGDFRLGQKFKSQTIFEVNSYKNVNDIIKCPTYGGVGKVEFDVDEVEVFTLSL